MGPMGGYEWVRRKTGGEKGILFPRKVIGEGRPVNGHACAKHAGGVLRLLLNCQRLKEDLRLGVVLLRYQRKERTR